MKITPEMVKKYSYQNNQVLSELNLDDKEIAFCFYCSAIGAMVPHVYSRNYSQKGNLYKQLYNAVQTASTILSEYAKPYITKNNNDVSLHYSMNHFLNSHKKPLSETAFDVADYMAGVVYMEALQQGYQLDNPNKFRTTKIDCDMVEHHSYYSPDQIANSIAVKARKSERQL